MADPTIQNYVESRLSQTKTILGGNGWTTLLTNTIAEAKALYPTLEAKQEGDLTGLEKSFLADVTAVMILEFSLDRYKEDAKAKVGAESMVHESADKLKFLQEAMKRFKDSAQFKAGRLGLDIVNPPTGIANVPAAAETGEDC